MGHLYESTGTLPDEPDSRHSMFGVVDLQTGKIQKKVELDRNNYFGEGITFLSGKVYQLTYTTRIGFVYDAKTFKKLGEFSLPMKEGWGMTTDGRFLIMSEGTSTITFMDPATFKVMKTLSVINNNGPVGNVNELEYVNGFIYANIYQTNNIYKIDAVTGKVVAQADLTRLKNEALMTNPGSAELNGIAYDSTTKDLYVTGKLWPTIYEISVDP